MTERVKLNLKALAERERSLLPGHRACSGCGFPTIIRIVLSVTEDPIIVVNATGCLEVVSSIFPYDAWPVTWVHNAFENAASTAAGIEAAIKALKRKGKIPADKKIRVLAIGGDGGTYDIGFQALSGAIERWHDFTYLCYDNGAYMNTGIQRSGATPTFGATTTSPAGSVIPGKTQRRKPLTEIIAAHDLPYAAQASPSHWLDLAKKAHKALTTEGPTFLNVLSPCPPGWVYPEEKTVEVAKLAVETGFWPLFEYDDGKWKINYKPKGLSADDPDPLEKFKPLEEFLKTQGRFKHILRNPELVERLRDEVRRQWKRLLALEKATENW